MEYLGIDKLTRLNCNLVAYSTGGLNEIAFASAFGNSSYMDEYRKTVNQSGKTLDVAGRYFRTTGDQYKIITSRVSGSDYSHFIMVLKDELKNPRAKDETLIGHVFYESNEDINLYDTRDIELNIENDRMPNELYDKFYDKFYKLSPVPVIRDWVPHIMKKLCSIGRIRVYKVRSSNTSSSKFYAFQFEVPTEEFRNIISDGLKERHISIPGGRGISDTMVETEGLDFYLNAFRDTLANRIQSSFVPRFVPDKDEYSDMMSDISDYASYMGNLTLFNAQKGVIQATSNALDHNKVAFIVGEMGSGKTAMAIATTCIHNHGKSGMTNIVMCPGHLVEKWKKEILRIAPNSDVEIVPDFDGLVSLAPRIKDGKRRRHLWLVLSKEVAKFGYQERPSAIYKACRNDHGETIHTYCCPECGQPLYTPKYYGKGRYRTMTKEYFDEFSFSGKKEENSYCMNKVRVYNEETGEYEEKTCGAKLWEATGRFDAENDRWINLGAKVGWIERCRIEPVYENILEDANQDKAKAAMLPTLSDAVDGKYPPQVRPIKYPLGKYVRRFLKGYIDYALIDEVHMLKGRDSLQGQAFGDLVSTAKHSLCFTGTLLNGYASGIFYLLYRAFPGLMKKEGFEFSAAGEINFVRQYGVYRESTVYRFDEYGTKNRSGSTKFKQLPGVSPIVFTKFLLENAAFISLEDIGTGLPGYEEIPVPVEMDPALEASYKRLESSVKSFMARSRYEKGGVKMLGQLIQAITIYPDQPYDQPNVINSETGRVIISPPNLQKDVTRNKDIAFVELVKEKVEAGEKVLVYYNWTNRTDLKDRLPKLLDEEGIKNAVMTASIKNSERETWVEKQVKDKNIDVLLCNPTLVETGLDLLDFTTIIFYQVGYNLFTLRQASRRSWRLSQSKDVKVYFMYYRNTVQEQALSLMATKLQAAMAIEGKFSEEGLNAMSNNEDVLTQIAASVADGIKDTVDAQVFSKGKVDNTRIADKEDNRKILVPKAKPVSSAMDRYLEKIAKSKKRHIPLRAISSDELSVLNNPASLFRVG